MCVSVCSSLEKRAPSSNRKWEFSDESYTTDADLSLSELHVDLLRPQGTSPSFSFPLPSYFLCSILLHLLSVFLFFSSSSTSTSTWSWLFFSHFILSVQNFLCGPLLHLLLYGRREVPRKTRSRPRIKKWEFFELVDPFTGCLRSLRSVPSSIGLGCYLCSLSFASYIPF